MNGHEIASIDVELTERPAQPPFAWRDGLPGSEPAGVSGVLSIRTRDGVLGQASVPRGIIAKDIVERRIRDDLLGMDATQREFIWHRLWELDRIEEFPIYMIGLVDVAIWDLVGQLFGVPAHAVAGTFRTSLPAYASTVTYPDVATYLDVVDQCLERGFRAIKLHAWGDAKRDARLAAAVRDRVGDEIELMYDGSAGFDLADAVYLGRALSELSFRWYEEPMREFSISSYRSLAQRVDVPLLVGETSDGAHWNIADFIASECAVAVRTSAAFKGGLTGALRIAHLAESHHLRAEVHGMGAANRHLCMAIPNTSYYEALVWGNPIQTDTAVGPDGCIEAPTGPGIVADGAGPGPEADQRPTASHALAENRQRE